MPNVTPQRSKKAKATMNAPISTTAKPVIQHFHGEDEDGPFDYWQVIGYAATLTPDGGPHLVIVQLAEPMASENDCEQWLTAQAISVFAEQPHHFIGLTDKPCQICGKAEREERHHAPGD